MPNVRDNATTALASAEWESSRTAKPLYERGRWLRGSYLKCFIGDVPVRVPSTMRSSSNSRNSPNDRSGGRELLSEQFTHAGHYFATIELDAPLERLVGERAVAVFHVEARHA